MTGDLASDSGRLCIGLGFGLESALHWTWLWTRVGFALDLALDWSRLCIGLGFGLQSALHWTTVSFALDYSQLCIELESG